MVVLGCCDTDWVGGHDKDILDAILPRNGFILATLSINKRKWGCLGCIPDWFGALRGAPKVTDG